MICLIKYLSLFIAPPPFFFNCFSFKINICFAQLIRSLCSVIKKFNLAK
uniref:Uncharacterized protein n=1 Tax=Rhizophora mucronata TaxID=61149 RepID=A0A2P2KWU3_RHIMU